VQYSSFKTVLLLGGAGATVFTFLIISGAIAVWLRNSRVLLGMFSCLTVMTGSIMIWQSNWQHTKAVPLWGFYLASVFSSTLVMILALMAANTAGHTKKAATSGLVWASYCASNGIAPLTVKTQEETNHYPTAWIIILSMTSLTFILLGLFRIYLLNLNKKRDEARLVDRTEAATTAFMDMTDGENENFRYQA
jgi:prolipoprotein diacylglyceryltransferase